MKETKILWTFVGATFVSKLFVSMLYCSNVASISTLGKVVENTIWEYVPFDVPLTSLPGFKQTQLSTS